MSRGLKPTVLAGVVAAALSAVMSAQAQSRPLGVFHTDPVTKEVRCVTRDNTVGDGDDSNYNLSALWDLMVFGEKNNPCNPEPPEPLVRTVSTASVQPASLQTIGDGTWGQTIRFTGTDAAGRNASFRMYVLTERYAWELGSSRRIEDAGTNVSFDSVFREPQFFDRFCSSQSVMGIGAASHEGPTALNHRLAGNRAATINRELASIARSCAGGAPVQYSVNLGEHQNTTGAVASAAGRADTSPQRRVVVVATESSTPGVNVQQAVRNGLQNSNPFRGFAIGDYDLFNVTRFGIG